MDEELPDTNRQPYDKVTSLIARAAGTALGRALCAEHGMRGDVMDVILGREVSHFLERIRRELYVERDPRVMLLRIMESLARLCAALDAGEDSARAQDEIDQVRPYLEELRADRPCQACGCTRREHEARRLRHQYVPQPRT